MDIDYHLKLCQQAVELKKQLYALDERVKHMSEDAHAVYREQLSLLHK